MTIKKIEAILRRLEYVESMVDHGIEHELCSMGDSISETIDDKLSETLNDLFTKLKLDYSEDLKKAVSKINNKFKCLADKVEGTEGDVYDLETDIDGIRDSLSDMSREIFELKKDIELLNNKSDVEGNLTTHIEDLKDFIRVQLRTKGK